MSRPIFYHSTIKNLIVAFSSIFNEVSYTDDYGNTIKVPLHYSPREKWNSYYLERGNFETDSNYKIALPRMGFEMGNNISISTSRMLNPMHRLPSDDTKKYMYNRIPYDFPFSLRIATKKFEDGLKIIEQIVPFFTPELNITLNDKLDFYNLKTDVPVVLNSVEYSLEYQGAMEYSTRTATEWTLQFTVKAYLYSDEKATSTIKRSIIDLTQEDMNKKYETLMSEVVPFEANKEDAHIIVDTIIQNDS